MEGEPSGYRRSELVDVLAQGEEQVKLLQSHLDDPFASEICKSLAEKLHHTFGTAISMATHGSPQLSSPNNTGSASPGSAIDSPGSESSDRVFKGQKRKELSKKRKGLPKWTNQVRVCSEAGFEAPNDDGYSWRKYGQKGILGAKHARGYYRCSHLKQGCVARKQVQRSDDDPLVVDVTYQGFHSCQQRPRILPLPANQDNPPLDSDKQQQDQQLVNWISHESTAQVMNSKEQDPSSSTFSFQSTPASCSNPDRSDFSESGLDDHLIGGLSPAYVPTAAGTSHLNYFSLSPYQMGNSGGRQSDLSDIVSMATSSVNSSIENMDFLLDPAELDANIPFDPSNFFPTL